MMKEDVVETEIYIRLANIEHLVKDISNYITKADMSLRISSIGDKIDSRLDDVDLAISDILSNIHVGDQVDSICSELVGLTKETKGAKEEIVSAIKEEVVSALAYFSQIQKEEKEMQSVPNLSERQVLAYEILYQGLVSEGLGDAVPLGNIDSTFTPHHNSDLINELRIISSHDAFDFPDDDGDRDVPIDSTFFYTVEIVGDDVTVALGNKHEEVDAMLRDVGRNHKGGIGVSFTAFTGQFRKIVDYIEETESKLLAYCRFWY